MMRFQNALWDYNDTLSKRTMREGGLRIAKSWAGVPLD